MHESNFDKKLIYRYILVQNFRYLSLEREIDSHFKEAQKAIDRLSRISISLAFEMPSIFKYIFFISNFEENYLKVSAIANIVKCMNLISIRSGNTDFSIFKFLDIL